MTVSILFVLGFVGKIAVVSAIAFLGFVVICWPMGDRDTNLGQWAVWLCFVAIMVDLMFVGYINYTL